MKQIGELVLLSHNGTHDSEQPSVAQCTIRTVLDTVMHAKVTPCAMPCYLQMHPCYRLIHT